MVRFEIMGNLEPYHVHRPSPAAGLGEMPCTMSHASIPAEQQTLPQAREAFGQKKVVNLAIRKNWEVTAWH